MKKIWLLVVAVAIALTVYYYATWQHWLAYATGSYNTQGVAHNYNAFSGSLSDVGQLTLVASLVASTILLWRVHTCHGYWWCWRHGHYNLEGTPYKVCAKHHPDDVPTAKEAMSAAKAASNGH
jgi:hypothetical protein